MRRMLCEWKGIISWLDRKENMPDVKIGVIRVLPAAELHVQKVSRFVPS